MTGSEENTKLTKRSTPEISGDKAEEVENGDVKTRGEEANEGVPVDHGYAWIIALCVFIMQTINFGFGRTISVLLKDITEQFDSSITAVSLCFTVYTLTGSLSSLLVSNVFMARFSVRKLCIVGSLLSAGCVTILAFSPNIIFFLSMFFFKGLTFGVILVCPNSLLGYYFKAKRGLATSLCNSGFCVSYIVFPPLAEFLNSIYGLRGCLLIMSAVELHMVACSLLLISTVYFKKRYLKIKQKEALQNGFVSGEMDGENTGKEIDKYDTIVESDPKSVAAQVETLEEKAKLISETEIPADNEDTIALSCSPRSISSLSPPASLSQASPIAQNSARSGGNQTCHERKRSLYASQQSLAINSVPYYPPEIKESEEDINGTKENSEPKKDWKYYVNIVFDTSLFQIYCFRMFVIFSPLASFSVYLVVYMPLIAQMAGLSQSEGALLMTISGFTDLFARGVLSLLADKKWFSKSKVTAFSMGVLAVVCHFSRLINNYYLFLGFATVVGVFGGTRQTLVSVIILEYIGVEKFAKGFGFLATVCTLTLSINHPIIGALIDITQSFAIPLHYVGTALLISVAVMLTEPCCKNMDEKRKKREEQRQAAEEVQADGEKTEECV